MLPSHTCWQCRRATAVLIPHRIDGHLVYLCPPCWDSRTVEPRGATCRTTTIT